MNAAHVRAHDFDKVWAKCTCVVHRLNSPLCCHVLHLWDLITIQTEILRAQRRDTDSLNELDIFIFRHSSAASTCVAALRTLIPHPL